MSHAHSTPLRHWVRLLAAALIGACLLMLAVLPVLAAEQEIVSAGPLTRIIVSDELNCQVAHRDDDAFELYGGEIGACGTFLAVDGTLYGPSSVPSGGFGVTPWTTVSQAPVTGSGSGGDPFRIVTVVDAPEAGLRVQQTDSYVVGSQSYRTDVQITNLGPAARSGILYRGGDCYLQESDAGYGRVDGGAPACIVDPALGQRIEQWLPITGGSQYFEGNFSEVWTLIGGQQPFPNTCACQVLTDNGAGLSWPVSVASGQSTVVSHETFFSPQGRAGTQESFTDSVPDPTTITLDPVVVVQSVAIAAGVIVLIPFPSALFNSTLEENYDEVMAGLARIRVWLAGAWAAMLALVRRQIAQRRAGPTGGTAPPTPPSPQEGVEPAAPADVEPSGPQIAGPASPTVVAGQSAPAPAAPARSVDFWRTPLGILAFVLLSALLYSFLDPTFGISLISVATFAGLAIGLIVVLLAYGVPLIVFARQRRLPLTVRALPATLLVGLGCVLVSRLTDFEPGYLYGLIVGFLIAGSVAVAEEGRAKAIAAGSSLAVAFVAWIALIFLRGGVGDALVGTLIEAAAVTVVVAGLENAVFGLLPLRFLPGEAVFRWDRRVWAVLIGIGIFGFAHVLLNPVSGAGYLADSTRTSFFTLIALLVVFGVASVLFWAYFRFRPARSPTPGSAV